jgi:hypothetical protein
LRNAQATVSGKKGMTIIHDIHLSLDTKQVIRREGIRQYSSVRPEIKAPIGELLVSIKDNHLHEPAMAYEIYPLIAEVCACCNLSGTCHYRLESEQVNGSNLNLGGNESL